MSTIFPKLLALFTKYAKLIPPSQLKALKDAKPFFDNSQPLELLAMYNDTDNTVLVTLGRKSYVVSKSVMLIPATLVDDEYKKFKITLDDTSGAETVTIEDASGNIVKMEQSGITIESKTDVTIKGVNVTVEASAQLTAKGAPIHLNP